MIELVIIVLLLLIAVLLVILLIRSSHTGENSAGLVQDAVRQYSLTEAEHSRQQLERLKSELQAQEQEGNARTQQTVVAGMSSMGQGITANVQALGDSLGKNVQNLSEGITGSLRTMREVVAGSQQEAAQQQLQRLDAIDRALSARQQAMSEALERQMKTMETRLASLETRNDQQLEALRQGMQQSMQEMRQENAQKLEEIRGTVDEKLQETLQKRLSDSFQTVSQQLEQVYRGLGEMQNLAADVGGLKQVLSGVKTRGILGEIQLGAILEQILAPEQYDTDIATIPGSRERVEFAVRLPGGDGSSVYLPIDSKFPGDTYMHLQEAAESGDRQQLALARKNLEAVLKKSAKDIRDKYVEPPYTTTFGIMFLPFEGLYAEAVNMGMIELLQRDYSINVAGPSTMAALLNSLQMGFRTLAIQKRSNEVWQLLGAVKTEFVKFEDVLVKMQGHLNQTSSDLETLMGTRTRAINRKLREVEALDEAGARQLLETE